MPAESNGGGLPDQLELILGLDPDLADTDGDGFSDAEEFARGSHPARATSVPAGNSIKLAMGAYESDGRVHVPVVLYFPDGNFRTGQFGLSILAGSSIVPVPLHEFRGGNPMQVLEASDPTGIVVILDPTVSSELVYSLGSFSLCATIADGGQYIAADAINLAVVDGVILETVFTGYRGDISSAQVGAGVGGVYRPLTPGTGAGGSPPPGAVWSCGQICSQTTVIVGVLGAVITQEVVAADCVDGWDAYCSPGCAATVGSTVKVIDPAVLVGG